MNIYSALAALLAASVGTTTLLISEDELNSIVRTGTASLAKTQAINDTETVKAARIMYQLHTGDMTEPSIEKLVELGYLDEKFPAREKVQVPQ